MSAESPTFRLEDDLLGRVSVELVGGMLTVIGGDHLSKEADVAYGQPQSVHLGRAADSGRLPAERNPQSTARKLIKCLCVGDQHISYVSV